MKTIEEIRRDKNGFVTETMLPHVIEANRLEPLLVRCGGGRFICPAQDVSHFIGLIERKGITGEGGDYVRDVSFPAKGGT